MIINTGMMLEVLSNGVIPPGIHRVVADPAYARRALQRRAVLPPHPVDDPLAAAVVLHPETPAALRRHRGRRQARRGPLPDQPHRGRPTGGGLMPMKIVVCDDDSFMREMVESLVRSHRSRGAGDRRHHRRRRSGLIEPDDPTPSCSTCRSGYNTDFDIIDAAISVGARADRVHLERRRRGPRAVLGRPDGRRQARPRGARAGAAPPRPRRRGRRGDGAGPPPKPAQSYRRTHPHGPERRAGLLRGDQRGAGRRRLVALDVPRRRRGGRRRGRPLAPRHRIACSSCSRGRFGCSCPVAATEAVASVLDAHPVDPRGHQRLPGRLGDRAGGRARRRRVRAPQDRRASCTRSDGRLSRGAGSWG